MTRRRPADNADIALQRREGQWSNVVFVYEDEVDDGQNNVIRQMVPREYDPEKLPAQVQAAINNLYTLLMGHRDTDEPL